MAKTLVIITGSFRSGGFERRLMQLLDWIKNNHLDFDVHVFYQSNKGFNKPLLPEGNMHYWPSHLFKNFIFTKWENYFFYKYLRYLFNKKKVNLFIGHQSILNRIANNRYIINDNKIDIIANIVNNLEYSPYKSEIFSSLKKCSSIICNSYDNQKILSEKMKIKNLFFIPNYYKIETKKYVDYDLTKKSINIVSCGSFDKQKNFKTLLRAVKAIKFQEKNIHFTIYGDGQQKNEFIHYLEEENINNVSFVNGKDFKKYVWQYDIFIMTSIFEGYPNALLEAQISGLPSIAFDIDYGPREIIDHKFSGILIDEVNVKDLVIGISDVIKDLNQYKVNTSKHSKKLLMKHSEKMTVLKMYEIIKV